ncbi:hypothetical protein [Acanthopleuribacter pedis]|uniref:Uncharacterized protein n=1 Tax=Acanthopleuribacter pedis TaxID=442870 RepID=A0A8J7QRS6_9BACT|nr:hypothetical protein [Acanthopleuribacter pedis]MBO1323050.1 hypothetical protein [Acanthopleuribacter pedis]
MYLKVDKLKISLLQFGQLFLADASEESLDYGYENVYEWMYVDIPGYDFSLNISREHGVADLDDAVLDEYEGNEAALNEILDPGPIYIIGWDRVNDCLIDDLSNLLIFKIHEISNSNMTVYPGRINIDQPGPEPLFHIKKKEI